MKKKLYILFLILSIVSVFFISNVKSTSADTLYPTLPQNNSGVAFVDIISERAYKHIFYLSDNTYTLPSWCNGSYNPYPTNYVDINANLTEPDTGFNTPMHQLQVVSSGEWEDIIIYYSVYGVYRGELFRYSLIEGEYNFYRINFNNSAIQQLKNSKSFTIEITTISDNNSDFLKTFTALYYSYRNGHYEKIGWYDLGFGQGFENGFAYGFYNSPALTNEEYYQKGLNDGANDMVSIIKNNPNGYGLYNERQVQEIRDTEYSQGFEYGKQYERDFPTTTEPIKDLSNLILDTLDAPIKILFGEKNPTTGEYDDGLFTFELLGVNMRQFVLSLMTLCVVFFLLKRVL